MNKEDIETIVKNIETKITNIRDMLADYDVCSSQQSKTILLAAAGKLASEFKPNTVK